MLRSAASTSPRTPVLPWIAVFAEVSLTGLIIEYLSSPLCYENCYSCKRHEIGLLEELAGGFLRCCAVVAGRDDAGGCCHGCGHRLPVPKVIFRRVAWSSDLYYRLCHRLHRLRDQLEKAAVFKLDQAERDGHILDDYMEKRVYFSHLDHLESRCLSYGTDDDDYADALWQPTQPGERRIFPNAPWWLERATARFPHAPWHQ